MEITHQKKTTAESTKKKGVNKPTPSQNKKNGKEVSKKSIPTNRNRQPSVEEVEDVDNPTCNNRGKAVDSDSDSEMDDDDVEVVEKPVESAEEELS